MHVHEDSGKEWLPRLDNAIAALHPFCGECGCVKNVTSDRARRLGYYANVLQEIRGHLEKKKVGRIADVQMRLIIKELQGLDGFEDPYWMRYSVQKNIFAASVSRYTSLSKNFVEGFL